MQHRHGVRTTSGLELWLASPDGRRVRFIFEDTLRDDAKAVMMDLERLRLSTAILSRDVPMGQFDVQVISDVDLNELRQPYVARHMREPLD